MVVGGSRGLKIASVSMAAADVRARNGSKLDFDWGLRTLARMACWLQLSTAASSSSYREFGKTQLVGSLASSIGNNANAACCSSLGFSLETDCSCLGIDFESRFSLVARPCVAAKQSNEHSVMTGERRFITS